MSSNATQKSFSRKFEGSAADLLQRARQHAKSHGATLVGDEVSGTFTAYGVEGTYQIQKQTITIKILKKPFVAPWNMVEESVDNLFR